MQSVRILMLAGTLAAIGPGCGGSGGSSGEAIVGQSAVAQIGPMLRVYQKGLKPPAQGPKDLPVYGRPPVPPPRGLKDIAPMARGFPRAVAAIRNKDALLYWKTDLAEGGDASSTVLAYAKEAPDSGGEVLFRDGSTRRMSAEQFRAARKPEGATTDDATPAPAAKAGR